MKTLLLHVLACIASAGLAAGTVGAVNVAVCWLAARSSLWLCGGD